MRWYEAIYTPKPSYTTLTVTYVALNLNFSFCNLQF